MVFWKCQVSTVLETGEVRLVSLSISEDKREVRVFDERETGGVSPLQSGRAGQCLQWLVVAGGGWRHVSPGPAGGGCCLKPPNKILRFSCHAAFLHSNTETTGRTPTISLTADNYSDILAQLSNQWPLTLQKLSIWPKMWSWEEQLAGIWTWWSYKDDSDHREAKCERWEVRGETGWVWGQARTGDGER